MSKILSLETENNSNNLKNQWYYQFFFFSVQVPEDGMKSLVRLASGDMRKALNILQVSNLQWLKQNNVFPSMQGFQ